MPDAAFGATERQFVGLLDAGSGCETVALTRYTMAGVPRGERIRARDRRRVPSPRRTSPRTPPTCWW